MKAVDARKEQSMLITMRELFLKRSRRLGADDGRLGSRLSRAVLRSLACSWSKARRRRKKSATIGVPAERLEPRLALTVGAYESVVNDTIFVHVDTAENKSEAFLRATEGGDLLIADNSGFFESDVVEGYTKYDNLVVFSGAKRTDESISAANWWIFDEEDGVKNGVETRLVLDGDGQAFAEGLAGTEGYDYVITPGGGGGGGGGEQRIIRGRAVAERRPADLIAEIHGTIQYRQSDGSNSVWYFSNFDTDEGVFTNARLRKTAGPGVDPQDESGRNIVSQTRSNVGIAVTDLPDGYNEPTELRIDTSGGARYIAVKWKFSPTTPPVITASYPVGKPTFNVNGTDVTLDYRELKTITRSGTLSKGTLNYGLPGAYETGLGDTTASLGRLEGTFESGVSFFTTHSSATDVTDPNANLSNDPIEQPSEFATKSEVEVVNNIREESFTSGTVTPLVAGVADPGRVDIALTPRVDVVSGTEKRDIQLSAETTATYGVDVAALESLTSASQAGGQAWWSQVEISGTQLEGDISDPGFNLAGDRYFIRSNRYDGVNVKAGSSVELVNSQYITWVKDGPSQVTFAPGPDIEFSQDILIELTSPQSTVNINSPLTAGQLLDVRVTNVNVNAQADVTGRFVAGRSTQLRGLETVDDGLDRPRLTLSESYDNTPNMRPEDWVVKGRVPTLVPVFGPGGSIASLAIPEGGEGYGYDPTTPVEITVARPEPQQAVVDVLDVSGSVDAIRLFSSGSGLRDGEYEGEIDASSAEDEIFQMIESVSITGTYDFFNGSPAVPEARPLVIIDEPLIARRSDGIGYGVAATAEGYWTEGVYDIVTPDLKVSATGLATDPGKTATVVFEIAEGDTGPLQKPALVNAVAVNASNYKAYTVTVGNTKSPRWDVTYEYSGTIERTIDPGSGYDPTRGYVATATLQTAGGNDKAPIQINKFVDGILAADITDGGLNYEYEEKVTAHVVTLMEGQGVSLAAYPGPTDTANQVTGSTFLGEEIMISSIVSEQTGGRDLREYLAVGMPIRGPGFSTDATIAGVDLTAGIVSVSVGGVLAPSLFDFASIYPHEYWVENQPTPENRVGQGAAVTLKDDFARVRFNVKDGAVATAIIIPPEDTPNDGKFPGRLGGSGYRVQPLSGLSAVLDIILGEPGETRTPPTVAPSLNASVARLEVSEQGSNYLTTMPGRTGTLVVDIIGSGGEPGTALFEVRNGQFTGAGSIDQPGSGFISRDNAFPQVAEPVPFGPGEGNQAKFIAYPELDGSIRATRRIDGGSEYVVPPLVRIPAPLSVSVAQAVAEVDLIEGEITGVNVQVAGSGFLNPPSVVIAPPGPEGVGRRALAVAIIEGGVISRVEVTDPGDGYTAEPAVTISSPFDPTLVETITLNANLEVSGTVEIYVADEQETPEIRRGELNISSQTTLGGGATSGIYIEARSSDVLNSGFIKAGKEVQVIMVGSDDEQYSGPFSFISSGKASLETSNLYLGLENQVSIDESGTYRNIVDLDTKIVTLRVSTADGSVAGTAAPYSLSISEDDNLTVDSLLRSGGDISLEAGGTINIAATVETDGALSIDADKFSVVSPVSSVSGPILIVTRNDLSINNGLSVLSPDRNSLRDDVVLESQGDIRLQGAVTAVNNIVFRAETGGINQGSGLDEVSIVTTQGNLDVTSKNDVRLRTDVTSATITVNEGNLQLVEENDIRVDVYAPGPAGTQSNVLLVALGVDPGIYGKNSVALDARLREVDSASVSAPAGSVKIQSDIATRFTLDRPTFGSYDGNTGSLLGDEYPQFSLEAETGLVAAGNVEVRAIAGEVIVLDAPVAGGNAREARYATSGLMSDDVDYDPGQAGVRVGELRGTGSLINEFPRLGQELSGRSPIELIGEIILVKDEVGLDRDQQDRTWRNGLYEIARVGDGVQGFKDWLLRRADGASSEQELPSGTYVTVLEGASGAVESYQIRYVPRLQQFVEVSSRSQLTVDTGGLYGLSLGDRVIGDAIVPAAEVAGIDWTNQVVTLGLPAGEAVTAISAATLAAQLDLPSIFRKAGVPFTPSENYVGLRVELGADDIVTGADHPIISSVKAALASGEEQKVRVSSLDGYLSPFASVIAADKDTLILSPGSELLSSDPDDEDWSDVADTGKTFQVLTGFVRQDSGRQTLNPSVRSQLRTLPISEIVGDEIFVKREFNRWDLVVPGQRISGDGLAVDATVLSVSPAARKIVLSAGAMPSNVPAKIAVSSSTSPNELNRDAYENISLGNAATAELLSKITTGMYVVGPGISANTVVSAVDIDSRIISVPAGSIASWGSEESTVGSRIDVIDPATGISVLGGSGVDVQSVGRLVSEPSVADAIVLATSEAFTDLDFQKLRVGMSVSADGIRSGAKLLSVDPVNRTILITPGSVIGNPVAITFASPVYDLQTQLEAGQISLAADGDKTIETLTSEGRLDSALVATVSQAKVAVASTGVFKDEIYRIVTNSSDADLLSDLRQDSRARFLDNSDDQDWQQNIFLGQQVVSDLVQFDKISLGLSDGERIEGLVISDREDLRSVPQYQRDGTGTRVTAIISEQTNSEPSEMKLTVVRWDHVGATDEFVEQARISGASVELPNGFWNGDQPGSVAMAESISASGTLSVIYQLPESEYGQHEIGIVKYRQHEIENVNNALNLVASPGTGVTGSDGTILAFQENDPVLLSPSDGPGGNFEYTAVTFNNSQDKFFVGYEDVSGHCGIAQLNTDGTGFIPVAGTENRVTAIAFSSNGQQIVATTTRDDGFGNYSSTAVVFSATTGETLAETQIGSVRASDVRFSEARPQQVFVALGDAGLGVLELEVASGGAETSLTLLASYNTLEVVSRFVESPLAAGGTQTAMVDSSGTLLTMREVGRFASAQTRSQVTGVDYRSGILSVTGDAIGLGDDLAIVDVAGVRYAPAPGFKTTFLTEATIRPAPVRYNDGGGSVDTGDSQEKRVGVFRHGYVVVDEAVGTFLAEPNNDSQSAWSRWAEQLDPGHQFHAPVHVYAKNVQGDWVYFAKLSGIDSYNNLIGLESVNAGDVLEQLRFITQGVSSVEFLITSNRVADGGANATDFELADGTSIRRMGLEADLGVSDAWYGSEFVVPIAAVRPADSIDQGSDGFLVDSKFFAADPNAEAFAVSLGADFLSYGAVVPGMAADGDGIVSDSDTDFVKVVAVDKVNGIVWLSKERSIQNVFDAPAGRRIQFSYSIPRPRGLTFAERSRAEQLAFSVRTVEDNFEATRLVADVSEILRGPLENLQLGATVLGNYEGTVARGGTVSGVDYRVGLVGLSGGVVIDASRLGTTGAHLVQFEDIRAAENGQAESTTISLDVEYAAALPVGKYGGLAVSVAGYDSETINRWASLRVGGDVFVEFVDVSQDGDSRDVLRLGVLQGYNPLLEQIYVRQEGEAASRLKAFADEHPPRLLMLDPQLSYVVSESVEGLSYDRDDPNYLRVSSGAGGSIEIVEVAELSSSYSSGGATRLGVSDIEDRATTLSRWLTVDPELLGTTEYAGVRTAGSDFTVSQLYSLINADISGQGVVEGSKVVSIGLTTDAVFVDTNFGVADGVGLGAISFDTDIRLNGENSGTIAGSYTQLPGTTEVNGDLLLVDGYNHLDELVVALRSDAVITVAMDAVPSDQSGKWVRDHARVIGVDPENSIVILEAGSLLTKENSAIVFFREDGSRMQLGGDAYLASVGTELVADLLPAATVLRTSVGVDSQGEFSNPANVLVALQQQGFVEAGNVVPQPLFSSYDRLTFTGSTLVYHGNENIGTVRGVDPDNALLAIEPSVSLTAAELSALLMRGEEIFFEVDGVLLETSPAGRPVEAAVVEASSSSTDWIAGSMFETQGDSVITRVRVSPSFGIDFSQIDRGDVVSGKEGIVLPSVVDQDGALLATRVVGIDPKNKMLAVAYADESLVIKDQRPAIISNLGFSSLTISSTLEDASTVELPLGALVGGTRNITTGLLNGDFVRLPLVESITSDIVGKTLSAAPGSLFGKGAEVLAAATGLGLVSVSPGSLVSQSLQGLQFYENKVAIEAWSEGAEGAFSGSAFTEARAMVSGYFPDNQLSRIDLDATILHEGTPFGTVTGFDGTLGLLGMNTEEGKTLENTDLIDVVLAELPRQNGYQIDRHSVEGTFDGTRLLAQADAFFAPDGSQIDYGIIEIGMPVWTEESAIIGYVSGLASVSSTQSGAAVLIGISANTNGQAVLGDLELLEASLVSGTDRIRFGGELASNEIDNVGGVVAELGVVNGVMDVESPEDPDAGAFQFIFAGMNGPRVTVQGGAFPEVTNLLGAAVSGVGVPAGTIVTGYDPRLHLLGFSNAISAAGGTVTVDITRVDSVQSESVTVGNYSAGFVGDLNGDLRLVLSSAVDLPLDGNAWLGKEAVLTTGQVVRRGVVRGIDVTNRLLCVDVSESIDNTIDVDSVTISRGAILGHGDSLSAGVGLALERSTTIFVDPNSLRYLQHETAAREFISEPDGNNLRITSDGSSVIKPGLFVSGGGLPRATTISAIVGTADGTVTVSLENYWTGATVTPGANVTSVLLSEVRSHDVAVGDHLILNSDDGNYLRVEVEALDAKLGMVVLENLEGTPFADGGDGIRVVATAVVDSFSEQSGWMAGEDAALHSFENTRFIVRPGEDLTAVAVGQRLAGPGLAESGAMVVTGVDVGNRLLGVRLEGGSLSTQTTASDRRVVELQSVGDLESLYFGSGAFEVATSSRAVSPSLDNEYSGDSVVYGVGAAFPFALLFAAEEQGVTFVFEGYDGAGQQIFEYTKKEGDGKLLAYDSRLGTLQLGFSGQQYDESAVKKMRFTISEQVSSRHFGPDDLVHTVDVVGSSFLGEGVSSRGQQAFAHRLYFDSTDLGALEDFVGLHATISGAGVLGTQAVTSFGVDPERGSYLTVAAGGVSPSSISTGSVLKLDGDDTAAGLNEVFIRVTGARHFVVGDVGDSGSGLLITDSSQWQAIDIGKRLTGSGLTSFASVIGFDVANSVVYLGDGGLASPEPLGQVTSSVSAALRGYRSAALGTSEGDVVFLQAGQEIDLSRLGLGNRLTGNPEVNDFTANSEIIGIDPVAHALTLTPGSVREVSQATEASARDVTSVTSQAIELLFDANQTTRSRGVDKSGPILRVNSNFNQWGRIFVGMKPRLFGEAVQAGLTLEASVAAIDSENYLIYLAEGSIADLGALETIRFNDLEGDFEISLDKDSDGRVKATVGRAEGGSTQIGSLSGDIIAVPESSYAIFRDFGADLLGRQLIGGSLVTAAPVIGFDPVVGLIAVPEGSVGETVGGGRGDVSLAEGLRAIKVSPSLDPAEAELTLPSTDFVRKSLVAVRPGQSVQGVGLSPSAIVVSVDPRNSKLVVRTRNDDPVLVGITIPRSIEFGVPSEVELGATIGEGSSTVTFQVPEFGRNNIQVRTRAETTITRVGASAETGKETRLVSRALTPEEKALAYEAFAKAQTGSSIQGPGVKPGVKVYRPVYDSSGVSLQLYNGSFIRKDSEVWNELRAALGEEGEDRLNEIYNTIKYRDDNGVLVDTMWRGEAASMLSAAEGDKILNLGATYTTGEKRDHVSSPIGFGEIEKIVSGAIVVRNFPDSSLLDLTDKLDMVIGSPFEDSLRVSDDAFTAVDILSEAPRLKSVVMTGNKQGVTRFVVGRNGEALSGSNGVVADNLVDNKEARSLGKMLSVWRATSLSEEISLDSVNPSFTFQFDSQIRQVRLEQELPVIDVPILIDGTNRYLGAGSSQGAERVFIDGSSIVKNASGGPSLTAVEGGTNGLVFTTAGMSDSMRQAGVQGLSFVGFGEGAAIKLNDAKNIIIVDNLFGLDAEVDGSRRANLQGVVVEGNSENNTVINNQFYGSDDTAIVMTGAAYSNFIVANTIGDSVLGTNDRGVLLEAGGNHLGVASAGFGAVLEGAVDILEKEKDAPVGERIVQFHDGTVDLSVVARGMHVIIDSYQTVTHEVVAIDVIGRRLTLQEKLQENLVGGSSQINDTLQQMNVVIGYQVIGVYNKNLLRLSQSLYADLRDRIFVGQSVSGTGVAAGTTIVGIQSPYDPMDEGSTDVKIVLNQRLTDFGYGVENKYGDSEDGAGSRLVAFGDVAGNRIVQSGIGVVVGLGWSHARFAVYEGAVSFARDPALNKRTFSGWSTLEALNKRVDGGAQLFAVLADKESPATVYRIPVANIDQANGRILVEDAVTTLERLAEGSWTKMEPAEIYQSLSAVEEVEVSFAGFARQIQAGDATTGSSVIKNIDATNLTVGMSVLGSGIPGGTTVISIADLGPGAVDQLTLSNDATGTTAGVDLAFVGSVPLAFEGYRESSIRNTEIESSYGDAIVVRDALSHVIGDGRAAAPIDVATGVPQENKVGFYELSSWAIDVEIPSPGSAERNVVGISLSEKEILTRMIQDLKEIERDSTQDDDLRRRLRNEEELELDADEVVPVYGYGVLPNVVVKRIFREASEWKLQLDRQDPAPGAGAPGSEEVFELTAVGPTVLSFGVDWYLEKAGVTSDLRVSDFVVSSRGDNNNNKEGTRAGQHLPEFIRVAEIGTSFIRVETPRYGQRILRVEKPTMPSQNEYEGVEGFHGRVADGARQPNPVYFVSSRFGNTLANNDGSGVSLSNTAASAAIASLSADGKQLAVAGNTFGLFARDDQVVVAENRRGPLDSAAFKVLYGLDVPEEGAARFEDYATYWGRKDQYGNRFAEESFEFVINLPDDGTADSDRPTFWIL